MGVRSRLTMRAVRQVNTTATTDVDGHPEAPTWATSGDPVACWLSQKSKRQVVDGNKIAYVEDLRLLVSLDAGWTSDSWSESDRILEIEDRQGAQLVSGPFEIEAIERYVDHFEILIKRVGGQLAGT